MGLYERAMGSEKAKGSPTTSPNERRRRKLLGLQMMAPPPKNGKKETLRLISDRSGRRPRVVLLLTADEVMEMLGVSRATLYRMLKDGRLPQDDKIALLRALVETIHTGG